MIKQDRGPVLHIDTDGTNGSTDLIASDRLSNYHIHSVGVDFSNAKAKFGTTSFRFNTGSDRISMYLLAGVADRAQTQMLGNNFTVSMWVNFGVLQTSGNVATLFCNGRGSGKQWRILFNGTIQGFTFQISTDGTNWLDSSTSSTPTIAIDTWYHIAFIRNGAFLTLYVDGTEVAEYDIGAGVLYDNFPGDTTVYYWDIGATYTTTWTDFIDNAHLEDIYVNNGYAMWTADFTPPTAVLATPYSEAEYGWDSEQVLSMTIPNGSVGSALTNVPLTFRLGTLVGANEADLASILEVMGNNPLKVKFHVGDTAVQCKAMVNKVTLSGGVGPYPGNGTPSMVDASSVHVAYCPAANAFNGATDHHEYDELWLSTRGSYDYDTGLPVGDLWYGWDFGTTEQITGFRIYRSGYTDRPFPKNVTFKGSDTGAWAGEETTLTTVEITLPSAGAFTAWMSFGAAAYRYLRMYINEGHSIGGDVSYMTMGEIELLSLLSSDFVVDDHAWIKNAIDTSHMFGSDVHVETDLSTEGAPVGHTQYREFDGVDDGYTRNSDLGDSALEVAHCRFRIHNKSKNTAQIIWKDGGGDNGVAFGLDSSNQLGIFGRASSSTQITIPPSVYEENVWYDMFATHTRLAIYETDTGVKLCDIAGVATTADGGAYESVGIAGLESPITGSPSNNVEEFEGDISFVHVLPSESDWILPTEATDVVDIVYTVLVPSLSNVTDTTIKLWYSGWANDNEDYVVKHLSLNTGDAFPTSCKAAWLFENRPYNEGNVGTQANPMSCKDSSGNINHMRRYGGADADDHVILGRRYGWGFDGVEDYCAMQYYYGGLYNLGISALPLTYIMEFSINALPASDGALICEHADGSHYEGVTLTLRSDGSLQVSYGDGTGVLSSDYKSYRTATGVIGTDTDYQIILSVSAFGTHVLYVDGVATTTTFVSGTATAVSFTDARFHIMHNPVGNVYTQGTVYRVMAFNVAMGADEASVYYDNFKGDMILYGDAPPLLIGVLRQHYDLENTTWMAHLVQTWDLTQDIMTILQQPYTSTFTAILQQPYGDYDRVMAVLEQYYGDYDTLLAILVQEYGDLAPIMAVLRQEYSLRARMIAVLVQPYSIVGRIPPGVLKQVWDIEQNAIVQAQLLQPYSMFPDSAAVDPPVAWVTIDGKRVQVMSIDWDYNIDSYCASFRVTLAHEEEWAVAEDRQPVITHINGVDHHTVVVSKSDTKTVRETVYSIEARSPSVLLDFPFASAVPDTFVVTGTASQIVSALAALEGLTITWHMDSDPPLTDEDVLVIGDSPLGGIRNIVNELGGRVNSYPDGSIHAVKRHPVDSDKYDDATTLHELTTGLDYIVLSTNTDKRSGFNKFTLSSDKSDTGYGLKSDSVSTGRIDIRATKVPWSSAYVELWTSDLSSVTILPKGVQNVSVTEEIEIKGGVGQVEEPFYGGLTWSYAGRTPLGTIEVTEDGRVTTATAGDTIVSVTYTTRHWLWETSDTDSEKVQFILVKP